MPSGGILRQMLITPFTGDVGAGVTNHLGHYIGDDTTGGNQYDYYTECEQAILTNWFRDSTISGAIEEGMEPVPLDADSQFTLSGSGWYKVKVEPPGWMDSLAKAQDYDTGGIADVLVDEDADTTPAGDLYASEIETAMRQYELLRQAGLTNQTYEEYLMTFGVEVPTQNLLPIPELLRYVRSWQYPSNTIDPSNGTPRSAVSWAIAERVDKKRFFKEPGFLCWCTCTRPKVYLAKQTSFAASCMTEVYNWLPATLWDDSRVGLKKLTQDTVLKDITDGVWFDIKDLFMYGDQFVNFLMTDTAAGMMNLPETGSSQGINRHFAPDADIKALFVTGASAYFVREDGVCDFNIASTTQDTSPTQVGL